MGQSPSLTRYSCGCIQDSDFQHCFPISFKSTKTQQRFSSIEHAKISDSKLKCPKHRESWLISSLQRWKELIGTHSRLRNSDIEPLEKLYKMMVINTIEIANYGVFEKWIDVDIPDLLEKLEKDPDCGEAWPMKLPMAKLASKELE